MSAITKRQQARNERALQDMTKSVAGNDRCADCGTKNPTWASWNLGVFLCMRCASLHRKLGTHVSKVKSLSMDSWSVEQVENMRKVGNATSNRQLNPSNTAPQIPVDVDEVDAALEKYIRQKYERRAFMAGANIAPNTKHNTGSTGTGSFGDEPPPLPPKPGKHWGFSLRSSSSTLPRSKTAPVDHIPTTISVDQNLSKPGKAGHLFGMRITSVGNNFDQKLNMLKEMGFTDAKQNQDILKNANGNLDQAVETLSRLGEGKRLTPQPAPARSMTPVQTSAGRSGLTLSKTRQHKDDDSSNNPWEVRDSKRSMTAPLPQVPVRSQSTEPTNNTWNPFLQQDTQAVAGAFQNMQISQPEQQPHQTVPVQQQPLSVQTTGNPWGMYMQPQHAMSVPAIPQSYAQHSPIQPQHTQSFTNASPMLPSYVTNSFMQSASPQSMTSSNPWSQQMTPQTATPATPHNNPFGLPWVETKQTSTPIPQQLQQSTVPQNLPHTGLSQSQSPNPPFYAISNQPLVSTPPAMTSSNPFQQQMAAQVPVSNYQQQIQQPQALGYQQAQSPPPIEYQPQAQVMSFQQQPQTMDYQHTGYQQPQGQPFQQAQPTQGTRHDKTSIMALYGQMVPQRPLQTLPEDSVSPPIPQSQHAGYTAGSMNPFAQQQHNSINAHASKESVDFQAFAQHGRQSPDAFAGLSSRFMR